MMIIYLIALHPSCSQPATIGTRTQAPVVEPDDDVARANREEGLGRCPMAHDSQHWVIDGSMWTT